MMVQNPISWIAVDWGSTRFRAWALSEAGQILGHVASDKGMSAVSPGEFETVLLHEIEVWLADEPFPVIACGMVGARQGWMEVPYEPLGTELSALVPKKVPTSDRRLDVRIVPGLKQELPPDVMRGEETQIAGFLAQNECFSGVICLPGTHSKWCTIENGRLTEFKTRITGELFDLLCSHSLLRHSVGDGWDDTTFKATVQEVFFGQTDPFASLFSIRANELLSKRKPSVSTARLSGLLIGAELKSAVQTPRGLEVVLIGSSEICPRYAVAIEATGAEAIALDGESLVVAGLTEIAQDTVSARESARWHKA